MAEEVLETLLMLRKELYQRFQSPGVYFRVPQMMCLKQKQSPWKVFKTYVSQQEQREATRFGDTETQALPGATDISHWNLTETTQSLAASSANGSQ